MNTQYMVPAAVALALHAGLFFGIRPDADHITRTLVVPLEPPPWRPELEPLPPPPSTDTDFVAGGKLATIPADLPDPPVSLKIDSITIPAHDPVTITPDPAARPGPIFEEGEAPGRFDGRGVPINIVDLDKTPHAKLQVPPAYPYEARVSGRPCEVLVEFMVDESGHVVDPHVLRSNDPLFEAPTLRAVAKWRFEPGRRNGRIVRFRMAVPVAFAVTP